jgi:hypothetical protein
MSYFDLEASELEEITRLGADHPSSSLPALYELYLFQVRNRYSVFHSINQTAEAVLTFL